jgi:hypothetical protein
MQDTAYVGILTAHQDGPRRRPLEQAPPRSRTRSPSGVLRPVRGATLSLERSRPARGITPPLEQVSTRSRVRSALGWGPPRSRVRRTRALAPYLGI